MADGRPLPPGEQDTTRMRRPRELLLTAGLLVAASAVLFVIQWEIFHDSRDAGFYLLQDLAFLPIQVLLVAILVESILSQREKSRLLHKMNMVIGAFFSEMGLSLLGLLTRAIQNPQDLRSGLAIGPQWTPQDWKRALEMAGDFDYRVGIEGMDLPAARDLLSGRRQLLTMLLANPNLMEHDRFTDLLWSVSHLLEELTARPSLEGLPPADLAHLAGDVRRVYSQLVVEWLLYCRHLQSAYPYIYSIMVRIHPLQESPSAVVR
jgi:hypothetical protein